MKYLKVDTQKRHVEARGSVVDVTQLILKVIGAIYDNYIAHGHLTEAEFFKRAIHTAATDPDCPVFKYGGPNGDSILLDVSEIKRMFGHGK